MLNFIVNAFYITIKSILIFLLTFICALATSMLVLGAFYALTEANLSILARAFEYWRPVPKNELIIRLFGLIFGVFSAIVVTLFSLTKQRIRSSSFR